MLRFAVAAMLVGILFIAGTFLHLLTTTYLLGLASALLIQIVLWIRARRRKTTN